MKTKFNYSTQNLFTPVIFRPDFNDGATLNMTQAWSLFFTGGREENAFNKKSFSGWFFTNLLLAIVFSGIIGAINFTSI